MLVTCQMSDGNVIVEIDRRISELSKATLNRKQNDNGVEI